ncbi:MAG: hypothetical protein ACYSWU_06780, partial [Planctomycetota bacterium]
MPFTSFQKKMRVESPSSIAVRHGSIAKRCAATALLVLLQLRFQLLHDLRMLEVEIVRFGRVGFKVVELAGSFRCFLNKGARTHAFAVIAVTAGAPVVEIFPRATANSQSELDGL